MAQVTQGSTPQPNIVVDQHLTELALNSSDKTFTVPTDETWIVKFIRYEFTATATVGTRTPTIQYRDDNSNDVIFDTAGATITASGSSTQEADTSASTDLYLPPFVLHPGYDVRIADTAAVDAAADDMVVHVVVEARSI